MKRWISLLLLLPTIAYADPTDSMSGTNIHLDASSTISLCAEDEIRLATNCDSGTTAVYVFDDDASVGTGGAYIIKVDGDANRIFTFDASQDTALTMVFGDSSTTTNQGFKITGGGGTDEDDTRLGLAGGSDTNITEGAYILMEGNEYGTGGNFTASTGDAAGSDMVLDATDDITLRPAMDANRLITFDAVSDTVMSMFFGDGSTTANQTFSISGAGGANDDDTRLSFGGGSAINVTEGGIIQINGNEFSGGGDVTVAAGDTAGDIAVQTTAATTDIELDAADDIVFQSNNVTTFTMSDTGTLIGAGTATLGWTIVPAVGATCTATCTSPCVIGQVTATQLFAACGTSITGDCLCAGAS